MSAPQRRSEHWAPNPDPTSIVVPGVDAAASVNDQIDQIDQLITIRLQNIDANFSRIQHIISTRLLPAFKRYAEGTEPVREAAKFWKSFYEAAAQVRIPIANDTSSLYHTEDGDSERDTTVEASEHDPDRTPTDVGPPEDSFVRGAPVSSTPLVRDHTALPHDTEDDESWAASIESPFERLGRQVRELTLEELEQSAEEPSTSAPSFSPLHGSYTGNLPNAPSSRPAAHTPGPSEPAPQATQSRRKGKSPLRENVLRQNAAIVAASDTTRTPPRALHTPRRTKTPKNPFLPPHSAARPWNGLVDLRQPSPARSRATSKRDGDHYDSDSSDDLFPPGMSPPVTMQFAMPARAQRSAAKLALTPARKAAARIGRDLVATAAGRGSAQRMGSGDASLSSVAPSLPSLTRYAGHPARAATAAAPVPVQTQGGDSITTPAHQIYRARLGPDAFARGGSADAPAHTHGAGRLADDDDDDDDGAASPGSDSDSRSPAHSEANPSAAFLFAAQNNARAAASADDSFGSSQQSSSSDEGADEAARAARHPLAHIFVPGGGDGDGAGGEEDSFEQDDDAFAAAAAAGEDEETVFGARQVGQAAGGDARLRIMRDALIDVSYPGAPSLNPFAQVEQSPTPYSREAEELR